MNSGERCACAAASGALSLNQPSDAWNSKAVARADALQNRRPRPRRSPPNSLGVLYSAMFGAFIVSSLLGSAAGLRAQSVGAPNLTDGEARLRFAADENLVLLPVDCLGRRRLFCVDTGAGATGFDISFLHELGRPVRTVEVQFAGGSSKRVELYRAPVANVAVLPLTGISEVLCADLWRIRAAAGSDVYGCLGMDFLRQFVVRIDFDQGKIAFLKAVPKDSGDSVVLHLRRRGRPPTVMVSLPGIGGEPFFIDTGLNGVGRLDKPSLEKLLKQNKATIGDTVIHDSPIKSSAGREVRLRDEVRVGSFSRQSLVFTEGADNVLGLGYLREAVATFDFPGEKLYLKEGGPRSAMDEEAKSGAIIWRPNGVTTAREVKESSAADRAGLKAGDIIEEIDLKLASSMTLRRIRVLFHTPGERILQVRRDDQSLRIVLQLGACPNNCP